MTQQFTHGGIPVDKALHWNDETYRRIGDIVYRLMSGNAASAQKAHNDFYEMRRHFIKEEFDDTIAELDAFRAKRNMPGVIEMIVKVQKQIVTLKQVVRIEQVSPEIPAFTPPAPVPVVVCNCGRKIPCEESEQMSLF